MELAEHDCLAAGVKGSWPACNDDMVIFSNSTFSFLFRFRASMFLDTGKNHSTRGSVKERNWLTEQKVGEESSAEHVKLMNQVVLLPFGVFFYPACWSRDSSGS